MCGICTQNTKLGCKGTKKNAEIQKKTRKVYFQRDFYLLSISQGIPILSVITPLPLAEDKPKIACHFFFLPACQSWKELSRFCHKI